MDMILNKPINFSSQFEEKPAIKDDTSSESSSDEIEIEFNRRRAAALGDRGNIKKYTISKKKNISKTRESTLPKIEQPHHVKKTDNLPQLKVTGNILVSESISKVRPPKFEHYSSKSSRNTIPVEWKPFSPSKAVKPRPNTVLECLNRPTITISNRDISETEKELRRIERERALMFSNQKTPDWAKGVSSMLAAPSRSTMKTSIISNTMKANDFLI